MSSSPEKHADVVYRRPPDPQANLPAVVERGARAFAPAIAPLITGFLLLLALISVLGLWSVRKMDDVGTQAREFAVQHSARLRLLMDLRLRLRELDNEARTRDRAESRRELVPPFDVRLTAARDKVNEALTPLDRPPLSEEAGWQKMRTDLQEYLVVTQNLRRYSLEGFEKYRVVDAELNNLVTALQESQQARIDSLLALQSNARRSIRLWSVIALLVGAFVAAGTVLQVQRQFRQVRRSMFEARKERAFTNQLLEGMVSAVVAIDQDDRIRSANAAFFKIYPDASVGASVFERLAPDDAMEMLETAMSTRVTKATYHGRWRTQVEQDEKSFDVYSSPLAINGDLGQIVTLVDATEAAESERTLRRSESLAAVGQATTQVAHEIRNPLGSIRLGVSMLRDSVNDPDALNTIELVERGIKHLNKLVVDVTQFSRQKALERSAVDLHDSLERSIDLVSERIREKNANVEKQFIDSEIIGQWDADQLRQVFVNVIANAIDASQENASVKVSTELLSLNGESDGQRSKKYARITIADMGKGMDKATRERIFEPFFTTKKRGTGLGLAIVKQIVEQHGGKISVASELGHGAQFKIDLPV